MFKTNSEKGKTILYEISEICEKHGILNVSDIPFGEEYGYMELDKRDFLNLLYEVYRAGAKSEKEKKVVNRESETPDW